MLADLRAAARAVGHPEWGHGGPHDAGHYNSRSWETGFFVSQGGNWQSEYGHFFLSWYR
jgi:beta-amylase